jgi:sterol desaturase/sphingolipid hydroxylase (fatty acid hydroxylase superfamily)
MFNYLWNVQGYFFWLLVVSGLCFALERFFPWRRGQKAFRPQFVQDIFYLFFNGHYFGLIFVIGANWAVHQVNDLFEWWDLPSPGEFQFLDGVPIWVQFIVFLVLRDFLEWGVHNLLHRVPWLWKFHKLHHSIETMDWIGNFRFHWMETVIYSAITWAPLVVLGVDPSVLLPIAVVSTLIGHLNHSNLKWDYGPLRFLVNSPKMHIWHHDEVMHYKGGQNFGIVLSVFDWVFNTAYMPKDEEQPDKLGFADLPLFPKRLISRLFYPLSDLFHKAGNRMSQ